jgi:hypothetical protein
MADQLLARIKAGATCSRLLASEFDFDVTLADPLEDVGLMSGEGLEPIAGEAAGGSYFLCGNGEVLYASSEGQAGLIGADLTEALELIVAVPFWRDCLKFSGGGNLGEMLAATATLAADWLEHFPEARSHQDQLREELGLKEPTLDDAVTKLYNAVESTEPDFILIDPDGAPYDSLFNTFQVEDNPEWRS